MSRKAYIYSITSSVLFFLVSIYLFLSGDSGWDKTYVGYCSWLAVLVLVNQALIGCVLTKDRNWVQIDLYFVIMFFAIHFWVWFGDSVGLFTLGRLPNPKYNTYVNYGVALSLLGICAFVLGFNLQKRRPYPSVIRLLKSERRNWARIGNYVFFSGALLTLLYALYFGRSAFEGNYLGSSTGGLGLRAMYLLQQILVKIGIAIILISSSNKNKIIPANKLQIAVFVTVLAMYLVLGDRSEVVYTVAVALFAYSIAYKKISVVILLSGMLGFSLLSSAVQIARTDSERSLATIYSVLVSGREEVSVVSGVENLAGSGFNVLAATSAIPEEWDFFNGKLKIKEALGIIPYGRYLFYKRDESLPFDNSSTFLTWYILGPNSSWGVGSTIIADLYVDFGSAGVVIGMFLLGLLAAKVRNIAMRGNSIVVIVAFSYFAGLFVILPRYSFLVIIRGLLWPLVFLFLLKRFGVGPIKKEKIRAIQQ